MPPQDAIHSAVKNALVKDGWTITADPYTISYEELTLFADLAAERPIAAERAGRKIVVEVKSFLGPSPVHDLKLALGQYQVYRGLLEVTASDYKLYLAVSSKVYDGFFSQKAIRLLTQRFDLSLLVVDVDIEKVVQWTN